MISRAAIDAGVNFFAGYPITPASSIYTALLNKLQAQGKIAVGASDEISALAMCTGASIRGAKSMTASSAPGLSLMVEGIGYAFASESPVTIVLGQRLGPSTGAATQSAQGDISFIQSLISGGYQIPVIAINSIQNAYELTKKAVNTAELLRSPVILLTEKDIIMSQTNINFDDFDKTRTELKTINRKGFQLDSKELFKTYNFNEATEIPEFLATGIGQEQRVVVTASMHDKAGMLSKNSPEAFEVLEHLRAKIEDKIDDYAFYDYEDNKSGTLLIGLLASDLSCREANKKTKLKANRLSLYTIFPVLETALAKACKKVKRVIIPEVNHSGQYAEILRPYIQAINPEIEIIKINSIADLISPTRIVKAIEGESLV